MDIPLLNLSSVLHSRLVDRAGEKVGRVDDLIVRLADRGYPPVTGVKARIGGREVFVPGDRIAEIEAGTMQLAGETVNLGRFERREGEVLLRQDLLGRRLINVVGARLVRADDLVLGHVGAWWRVVGVDTSFRSLFRRLLPRVLRRRGKVRPFLDWESVEPFVGHVPSARLRMGFGRLAKLHPAQLADLVEAASHEEGEEIIVAVGGDRELEADVFEELDRDSQARLFRTRSDTEVAEVLARMRADDAADAIMDLPQGRRRKVLDLLAHPHGAKVLALLRHHPATAGGLMGTDFLALGEDRTIADALQQLRVAVTQQPEALTTIHSLHADGTFAGTLPLVRALQLDATVTLREVADADSVVADAQDDITLVARRMADFNLLTLPVLDSDGRLLGIVTVDDVLEATIPADWSRRSSVQQSHRLVRSPMRRANDARTDR